MTLEKDNARSVPEDRIAARLIYEIYNSFIINDLRDGYSEIKQDKYTNN